MDIPELIISGNSRLKLDHLAELFKQEDRHELIKEMYLILNLFRGDDLILKEYAREHVCFFNYLLNAFFMLIFDERTILSFDEIIGFIDLNTVIQNLTKISDLRDTTIPIALLLRTEVCPEKILIFHNNYSEMAIDSQQFARMDKDLKAIWTYCLLADPGCVNQIKYNRRVQLLEAIDENTFGLIIAKFDLIPLYIGSSYIEPVKDIFIRKIINAFFKEENPQKLKLSSLQICKQQEKMSNLSGSLLKLIRNWFRAENGQKFASTLPTTLKRRIGIITLRWWPENVIYRTMAQSVMSLFGAYELVLITKRIPIREVAREGIQEVIEIPDQICVEDYISKIRALNLDVIFYPDIGLTKESIVLSNKRLAPIQITAYGHPVSTQSDAMDYYLGGQAVEHPILAKEQFSERLVLLPGLGIQSVTPTYELSRLKSTDQFIIGCPWNQGKMNAPLIQALKRILDRANRPIIFRFLPSSVAYIFSGFIPTKMDLEDILGPSHVEFMEELSCELYMQKLEEVAFAIDSYPFGGFNTITDVLYLQKPMVTFEGDRAFNRLASAVMRLMGLEELIATSWETYEDLIVRLINDDPFRESVRAKITRAKFDEMIEKSTDPTAFRRAIDYLIENHERLQQGVSREPIIIS